MSAPALPSGLGPLVGDVVARNASLYPGKPALVSAEGRVTTFGDFADRVGRLAAVFDELGLQPGARVAILSRNRPEYLETICAAASRHIAVPLNWRLAPGEIASIVRDCTPDLVVADTGFAPLLDDLRPDLGFVRHFVAFDRPGPGWLGYEDLIAEPRRPRPIVRPDPRQTACIVYTSGTTGRPKGAELTHRGILANCALSGFEALELTPDDVTLAVMPFFHVGGLWYHLFPSFAAGCTTHVAAEFDPAAVLALIARERVTNLHVVPTMLHAMLAVAESGPENGSVDLSSLRAIYYAASSIPVSLLRRAMATFAECGFLQAYGSTEAGAVSALSAADHRLAARSPAHEHLLLSCGRALAGVEVSLLDALADGTGQIGEIAVCSSATMARYWGNPDATANAVRDGWVRTGDLARQDEDGYLYVVDRKSDMIVTGGENVYPREVEEVLLWNEALAEVAVFDLPDERWVQRVVAAVVPRPGTRTSPEAVIAHARSHLAAYKCPKQVFLVEMLPKNGAGKVLRKTLRQDFAAAST